MRGFILTAFAVMLVVTSKINAEEGVAGLCLRESNQEHISQYRNRLAFRNQGGLMNGGVCWWHSRFLRNATYLAYFSPDKERPTTKYETKRIKKPGSKIPKRVNIYPKTHVRHIIKAIKKGKRAVEVPGFSNLSDFSHHYRGWIQKELENWQIEDGFIRQDWIDGLSGSSKVSAEKLAREMDKLYVRVGKGEVVYQKLQIPGIDAHAWLVIGMKKKDWGYIVNVVDSNYGSIRSHWYEYGDTQFSGYRGFVPYTEQTREERKLASVQKSFCKKNGYTMNRH